VRPYLAAVLAAALAVVIPACGTDGGSHTGRSTDNANVAHAAAAMARISRARRVPEFVAPGAAFRTVAGVPAVTSEHTPLRVFDRGNVVEAGTPPVVDRGYGDAYVAGYERLWGVGG